MGRKPSHEFAAGAEWAAEAAWWHRAEALKHQRTAAQAADAAHAALVAWRHHEWKARKYRRLADEALARELAESLEANGE